MPIRPEFTPPDLDETRVARLTELAAEIDGANPGEWEDKLAEFNQLAGTSHSFDDFQGIYGGEEHETYIRRLLVTEKTTHIESLSRAELIDVFAWLQSGAPSEVEHDFAIAQLKHNLNDPQISDLLYWPGEYLCDNTIQDLTPEQMADAALKRQRQSK